MNPEPAITRMKERDLHTERDRWECVTCPVKTQYVEKNTLCIYVCSSLSRNINQCRGWGKEEDWDPIKFEHQIQLTGFIKCRFITTYSSKLKILFKIPSPIYKGPKMSDPPYSNQKRALVNIPQVLVDGNNTFVLLALTQNGSQQTLHDRIIK